MLAIPDPEVVGNVAVWNTITASAKEFRHALRMEWWFGCLVGSIVTLCLSSVAFTVAVSAGVLHL